MAVSVYFGLPGCGKTTTLTKLAYEAVSNCNYKHVYSNVGLNIPGVTYIENSVIGRFELRDCLLLIDEGTLFADNRAYKEFSKERIEYFLTHRHRCADIVVFTQKWDALDIKIRTITDRVFYVYKPFLTGCVLSKCVRVPYGLVFPDPKKGGDKLGEIIQGYMKPPFFSRVFAKRIYRPRWYPYFDSWEVQEFDPLPDVYSPVPGNVVMSRKLSGALWFPRMAVGTFSMYRFGRKQRKARRRSERLVQRADRKAKKIQPFLVCHK